MKRILKHIFVWMMLATFVNNIIVPKAVYADIIGVTTADELRARFATNTGGDVRLDSDITLSGNYAMRAPMNLDLNGHILTIATGKCLFAYSNIVVFDSQENERSAITGSFDNNYILRVGSTSVSGSITLESGKIISTSSNGRGILISKGNVTVNNGLIQSAGYAITNNDTEAEITINNGELKAVSSVAGIYSPTHGAKLTVNGGKISATNFAIYHAGTFIMNNGTVESGSTTIRINPNSQVEINGGKIITTSDNIGTALTLQDGTVAVINNVEIYGKNGIDEYDGGGGIAAFKNVDLTINNAVIESWGHAISGNGSWEGNADGSNAKITINNGKFTSYYGNALYIPQVNGETVINGGELTGVSGIEIRAGKLTVKSGKITSTSEYKNFENTNGGTTNGAAISIAQHTSHQPIEVIIEGGEMSAAMPISFTNPLHLDQSIVDQVSITTRGGYFSSSVAQYVEDGYNEVVVNHNNARMFYVTKPHSLSTEDTDHIRLSKRSALFMDEIEIDATAPEGYTLKIEVKDGEGKSIEVVDNKFIMPDSDVNVAVTLEEIPAEPETPIEQPEENEEVPEVPETGYITNTNSMVKVSVVVGAVFGGLAGLYASRKKIRALFE